MLRSLVGSEMCIRDRIYGNLSAIGSSFIVKLMVILDASPMHYSLLSAIAVSYTHLTLPTIYAV